MNKYLYKLIAFIVIFGILLFIGSREMRRRGINQKNFSPADVAEIYESYNLIGIVNYIEIEVPDSEADSDGYSYKKPVRISDKNDISLLRNELNNSKELGKDDSKPVGNYYACTQVTFHLKNGEELYCGIDSNIENPGAFFISKDNFHENRTDYKILSGDDVSKQVKDLYNKYSRLIPDETTGSNGDVSVDDIVGKSGSNTTGNVNNSNVGTNSITTNSKN